MVLRAADAGVRPASCCVTLQGLETLDGQLRAGLPFNLGSDSINAAVGDWVRSTHERVGAAQRMPKELYSAGGWAGGTGGWVGW